MKTMIFSGRTMREAMAQAKQRFGADIDILSSDQVGDEVQVKVVVPEASSPGRRRKAVDRVSASIKALADAPMKGERLKSPVKGIETAGDEAAVVAGQVRDGEKAPEAAEAAVADGAGEKAGKPGRVSKTARGTKAGATRKSARGSRTPAARERVVDETGDDGQAGDSTGVVEDASPVTVAAGEAAAATETVAQEADGPVSTLDFERQRRLRQGKGGALPTQASSLVQALVAAQTSRTAQTVAAKPAAGVPAQGVPGAGAATLARSADAATTAGAWRTAGQAINPASAAGASASGTRVSPAAAPDAPGGADTSGSRLSLVLSSARRMLGNTPGRWLGRRGATEAVLPPASAPVQATATSAGSVPAGPGADSGFGQDAPMPLSSLLQSGESDWPSLSLQTDDDEVEAVDTEEDTGVAAGVVASAHVPGSGAQSGVSRSRESRLDGIGWFESARRRPAQMRLLRNLLSCQFSPALARTLVSLLPVDYSDVQADEWLRQMMLRALAGVNGKAGILPGHTEQTIFDRGGIFALIGPTGVGKTTSIAKIAAHHVLRHGPKSLALITADVYRIGAQEQLRAFGKMLGVPVQVAQDREVLQTLLKEHEDRSLVLIDTAGISQRDERVSQLTSALSLSQVKRVLVLNAGTQPGGIEDVLRAFGASETAGVLLSKVDEAVGLGACFDALIRHRLPLVGYTDGQRVPEDYHPANLGQLIESALSGEATNRYPSLSMSDSEIRHLFEGTHV